LQLLHTRCGGISGSLATAPRVRFQTETVPQRRKRQGDQDSDAVVVACGPPNNIVPTALRAGTPTCKNRRESGRRPVSPLLGKNATTRTSARRRRLPE
jgi:hypothetical protein